MMTVFAQVMWEKLLPKRRPVFWDIQDKIKENRKVKIKKPTKKKK